MAKTIDVRFDSEKDNEKGYFQIASGYISETVIFFEKENVFAVVHAKGHVAFYDANDTLLAEGDVPAEDDGKEVYTQLRCRVEENTIMLCFPICRWIDNYPHCDGEHDRWDCEIVGCHPLTFDLNSQKIV
ncbi:MAG: hypothetical protein IJO76_07300 [Clostridia bacterium]|nr:hypothetical protein [Clostridia bacterium]